MKRNKRPRRKMYGSYKAYDNSLAQNRARTRRYKFAEASEEHLQKLRQRLRSEHKALMKKKLIVGSVIILIGVLAMVVWLH